MVETQEGHIEVVGRLLVGSKQFTCRCEPVNNWNVREKTL